jgi:hypothetical protein
VAATATVALVAQSSGAAGGSEKSFNSRPILLTLK